VEHYADGDVFDAETPTRYHDGGVAGLYARGPDLPKHFIDLRMSLRRLAKVVRALRTREEFTLSRLAAAKRAYSAKPRPWTGRRLRKPQPA
jgi:hypothetical protein